MTERSVLGIDLAGSESRTTGLCRLGPELFTETRAAHSDADLLGWASGFPKALIAIDAPLSLPRGRVSLDVAGPPHFRACDRELRRLGIPFFPLTLGPMRMLTRRGMLLKTRLESEGHRVVESYPGGVQDLLGWPRKGRDAEPLRRAMRRFGFSGDVERRSITHDELDAVACAFAGWSLLDGTAVVIGDPTEGEIVLAATPEKPMGRRIRAANPPR